MRLSLFIVFRSLFNKRENNFLSFISIASISGIALGIAILNIALTILNGFENSIEKHLIEMNAHITVSGFGNRNLEFSYSDLSKIQNKFQNIVSISPFISKNGILKNGKYSEGISIEAIDPNRDNSNLRNYIISGDYDLNEDNKYKVLIGEKLADKLYIKVGDLITLFTLKNDRLPSLDNPPIIEKFLVTGIYRSGMAEFDDLKVYTNLNQFQELTDLGEIISGFYIKIDSLKNIQPTARALNNYLGYPYYVRSFYKTHQHIFTWLELQKKPVPIVLGLIMLVAAFNIIGTLLMNIIQQLRKIGILKVLGMESRKIRNIYIIQGLIIALTGIFLGNLLTLLITYIQINYNIITLPSDIYFISEVPVYYDAGIYFIVSLVTLLLSLLISYIPSRIASGITPLTILRFD